MKKIYENLIINILKKYNLNCINEITGETNYVSEKIMKSFDMLSFITDIEVFFEIEFSPEEMYGDEIQKISGLAKLVEDKKTGKKFDHF